MTKKAQIPVSEEPLGLCYLLE